MNMTNAVLTEFPGAYHAYDTFFVKDPMNFPEKQTTRHCLLVEGNAGELLNSKTGAHHDLNDPCVEKGAIVGYNEEATKATTKQVKEFLLALPSSVTTNN